MDSPINSNDTCLNKIESKKTILLRSLKKYWTIEKKRVLRNIVSGKTVLSLRIIDWFVTNYSRTDNIRYANKGVLFTVYEDYKNQLRAYSKKLFDPFCRRDRIEVEEIGRTTIGQLNFFRWAIENNVLSWALEHCKDIEIDMVRVQITRNVKRTRKDMKKIHENPGFVRETVNNVVSFS